MTTDINDILSINWYLDGIAVGSGNSVETTSPLGSHELSVVVDTAASGIVEASRTVTVDDTTSPVLNIRFIDQRTGQEVIQVPSKGRNSVIVSYDVTDTCDPAPATSDGVVSPVNIVNDGSTIDIVRGVLATSAVNVSAHAIDASGNGTASQSQLLIVD